jgi:hypothetical protein
MATEKKVKVTPAQPYPLGHAKENKDASAYTGFKYPSGGGNDIGVYKQPMTNPKSADIGYKTNPNTMSAVETRVNQPARTVSVGDRANNDINPYGVGKMRGYGAATKGRKISGKMG